MEAGATFMKIAFPPSPLYFSRHASLKNGYCLIFSRHKKVAKFHFIRNSAKSSTSVEPNMTVAKKIFAPWKKILSKRQKDKAFKVFFFWQMFRSKEWVWPPNISTSSPASPSSYTHFFSFFLASSVCWVIPVEWGGRRHLHLLLQDVPTRTDKQHNLPNALSIKNLRLVWVLLSTFFRWHKTSFFWDILYHFADKWSVDSGSFLLIPTLTSVGITTDSQNIWAVTIFFAEKINAFDFFGTKS